jgi:hypothetical protein
MGVQIFLLDHRKVRISIDGHNHMIGTLRRFCKVTEVDSARHAEIEAGKETLRDKPSPNAVMVVSPIERPLAASPTIEVSAYPVLGWDKDRYEVTDWDWDHLPVLGYAVKDPDSGDYVLHELLQDHLYPLEISSAVKMGFMTQAGQLLRLGQPSISNCHNVRPFLSRFAEAECIMDNGRVAKICTKIEAGVLPDIAWYLGKRPLDVASFA